MTAKDLLMYQFGGAEAIRRVAGSRWLLGAAVALVVITSAPRNYDQTFIGEVPWWPVIPLVFSFFSGTFLFLVLQTEFIRQAEEKFFRKYLLFLGLFWMTAPVAWLYGIPVERFLDARGATVANLWMLGIVSVWRVVLITRVVTLIYDVDWLRAAGGVLLAASVEVVAVLFSPVFGESIARGMGGMRNSPEQEMILGVMRHVFTAALIAVPVLLIAMVAYEFKWRPKRAQVAELPKSASAPWSVIAISGAAWVLAAIVSQQELEKEWRYRRFLEQKDFRAALNYLSTLEKKDWPPAKSFRPDPYEREVQEWLPGLMGAVTGDEKRWVQEKLLWVFEKTFEHRWSLFTTEELMTILKGVEKFEGGRGWIKTSERLWVQPQKWDAEAASGTNLVEFLESYGVKVEMK